MRLILAPQPGFLSENVAKKPPHCLKKHPRRESNPDLEFRKPLFYPLNYGDGLERRYRPISGRASLRKGSDVNGSADPAGGRTLASELERAGDRHLGA